MYLTLRLRCRMYTVCIFACIYVYVCTDHQGNLVVLNTSLDGCDINLLIKLTGMYEIPQLLYNCSNTYVYVCPCI